MKFLPFTFFILCSVYVFAQPKLQKQAMMMTRVIEKNHYAPKPVNDSFSLHVFNAIVDELDSHKLYFTQYEVTGLTTFSDKIDDELAGKSWGFVPQLTNLYRLGLTRADSMYSLLLQQKPDFTENEYYPCIEQRHWATSAAEYNLAWKQYVKWLVLHEMKEEAEDDKAKFDAEFISKHEAGARKTVLENAHKRIAKKLEKAGAVDDFISEIYLNKIASVFDPHTEYFSPEEKNSFEEELSTEVYDYGFSLIKNEKGEYVVDNIVPGSAAWKSGALHKNDVLVELQQGKEKPLELKDASTDAVVDILANTKINRIQIKVRSADGSEKTVPLEKQLEQNEENTVTGFVLSGAKKIGYISLPSFYTEWEYDEGAGCANDVAKEIVKLKTENIDGLILDIRYNGGGSVEEAIELAGIFIDIGPLAMLKYKDGKALPLKDPARGTIYDGPLLLMINGQSASASELLAGTLQDYNRAVICGSPSFGKATMQVILPVDTNFNKQNPKAVSALAKEYGYVKTTIGKLFRVTGKTAQLNGVIPDFVLPDAFEITDYTERSLPYALPSDTITKNGYYTALPPPQLSKIQSVVQANIAASAYFTKLKADIESIQRLNETCKAPLQWEAFSKWYDEQDKIFHEDTADMPSSIYTVQNSSFTASVVNLDSYAQELNDETKKDVQDDPYIEEAFFILQQIIQLKN